MCMLQMISPLGADTLTGYGSIGGQQVCFYIDRAMCINVTYMAEYKTCIQI